MDEFALGLTLLVLILLLGGVVYLLHGDAGSVRRRAGAPRRVRKGRRAITRAAQAGQELR